MLLIQPLLVACTVCRGVFGEAWQVATSDWRAAVKGARVHDCGCCR